MGKAIANRNDATNDLRSMLLARKEQIQMALPRHLTSDRLIRVVMTTVQKNPALLNCTRESLIGAIYEAAQLGLEPDGVLGHAYLIPYNTKLGTVAQLIVGYKGLIDLVRRSGQLSTVYAVEVYEGDGFDYQLGTDPCIRHKPGKRLDAEFITHIYAVAKLRDGGTQFEVMTLADIEKIRKRSKASSSGPWVTDWGMMARKTVLRRLCKVLPVSIEAARAIANDDLADIGEAQEFELPAVLANIAHESEPPKPAKPSNLADLEKRLTAPAQANDEYDGDEFSGPEWNVDEFQRLLEAAKTLAEVEAIDLATCGPESSLDAAQRAYATRYIYGRRAELQAAGK